MLIKEYLRFEGMFRQLWKSLFGSFLVLHLSLENGPFKGLPHDPLVNLPFLHTLQSLVRLFHHFQRLRRLFMTALIGMQGQVEQSVSLLNLALSGVTVQQQTVKGVFPDSREESFDLRGRVSDLFFYRFLGFFLETL